MQVDEWVCYILYRDETEADNSKRKLAARTTQPTDIWYAHAYILHPYLNHPVVSTIEKVDTIVGMGQLAEFTC